MAAPVVLIYGEKKLHTNTALVYNLHESGGKHMKTLKKLRKWMAVSLAAVLFALPLSGCFLKVNENRNGKIETLKPDKKDDQKGGKMQEPENWAEHMNVIALKNDTYRLKTLSFDERLMAYLSERTEGNFMASPLSFRYALGLLLAGAEGETKAELLQALGVESEQEWTDSCLRFNAFVQYFEEQFQLELEQHRENVKRGWIEDDRKEPFWALRVANSVWRNENLDAMFTEQYTESVSKNYAAEYRSFLPGNVVEKVNEWAAKKTEDLIERLLPDGYDTDRLGVILMNALYFKDNWINEFYEGGTAEGDFTTKSGSVTRKEFMNQMDHFEYYEDEETQLVILPMNGGVCMAFVLGDDSNLAEKINKAESRRVDVTIPKLDLETSFDQGEFVDFLRESGVSLAFSDQADFSGMIDADVWVSDIIQKTRIKLDEEGVEAAAVTALMMCGEGFDPNEPVVFRADRPFYFAIYANVDGEMATLFAGKVVE